MAPSTTSNNTQTFRKELFLVLLMIAAVAFCIPTLAQTQNPVQLENAKPGTTSWNLTNSASNHEIEGYASLTSVNAGQQISFYVNTSDPSFTLTIYRLGWYGGLRVSPTIVPTDPHPADQPTPAPHPD